MNKLCKSRTDRKIAGVCGGIAEYLNADPTLIRLAFLILCGVSKGSTLLVYLAAALIMPEAEKAA